MTRLLIVESDPEQAAALVRAFKLLSAQLAVLTASTCEEAIRILRERRVELVLTDLLVPGLDGREFLAWMNENYPDVPAFAMSANGASGNAVQLNGCESVEHFHKPIDAQAVLSRFMDVLSESVRGHVRNVSLTSFLQLLEMERKTCYLRIECGKKSGSLTIRQGVLVAAETGDSNGEAAAIAIIAWPYPNILISRPKEFHPTTINASLGFILMEAMRLQDEAARDDQSFQNSTSAWPPPLRHWRPPGSDRPPPPKYGNGDMTLPSGAQAIAIVEVGTGNIVTSSVRAGVPIRELARMAAQVLVHETTTLRLCNEQENVEELVLTTTSRCDVIRPLDHSAFGLLVFAPAETNLVMARIELEQFIAAHRQHALRSAHAVALESGS
jgi:CheY-like chemotaxis protein